MKQQCHRLFPHSFSLAPFLRRKNQNVHPSPTPTKQTRLRFNYSPRGEALTALLWGEPEYEAVETVFTIERTVTEIFRFLRLIRPIIGFFNASDNSGLVNRWNWVEPGKSLLWLLAMSALCHHLPRAIFSFILAYLAYVGVRQFFRRRACSFVRSFVRSFVCVSVVCDSLPGVS